MSEIYLLAFLKGFDSSKGGKSLTLQKLCFLSFMFVLHHKKGLFTVKFAYKVAREVLHLQ